MACYLYAHHIKNKIIYNLNNLILLQYISTGLCLCCLLDNIAYIHVIVYGLDVLYSLYTLFDLLHNGQYSISIINWFHDYKRSKCPVQVKWDGKTSQHVWIFFSRSFDVTLLTGRAVTEPEIPIWFLIIAQINILCWIGACSDNKFAQWDWYSNLWPYAPLESILYWDSSIIIYKKNRRILRSNQKTIC